MAAKPNFSFTIAEDGSSAQTTEAQFRQGMDVLGDSKPTKGFHNDFFARSDAKANWLGVAWEYAATQTGVTLTTEQDVYAVLQAVANNVALNPAQFVTNSSFPANLLDMGWDAPSSKLVVKVNSTSYGNLWPINISGNAATANGAAAPLFFTSGAAAGSEAQIGLNQGGSLAYFYKNNNNIGIWDAQRNTRLIEIDNSNNLMINNSALVIAGSSQEWLRIDNQGRVLSKRYGAAQYTNAGDHAVFVARDKNQPGLVGPGGYSPFLAQFNTNTDVPQYNTCWHQGYFNPGARIGNYVFGVYDQGTGTNVRTWFLNGNDGTFSSSGNVFAYGGGALQTEQDENDAIEQAAINNQFEHDIALNAGNIDEIDQKILAYDTKINELQAEIERLQAVIEGISDAFKAKF